VTALCGATRVACDPLTVAGLVTDALLPALCYATVATRGMIRFGSLQGGKEPRDRCARGGRRSRECAVGPSPAPAIATDAIYEQGARLWISLAGHIIEAATFFQGLRLWTWGLPSQRMQQKPQQQYRGEDGRSIDAFQHIILNSIAVTPRPPLFPLSPPSHRLHPAQTAIIIAVKNTDTDEMAPQMRRAVGSPVATPAPLGAPAMPLQNNPAPSRTPGGAAAAAHGGSPSDRALKRTHQVFLLLSADGDLGEEKLTDGEAPPATRRQRRAHETPVAAVRLGTALADVLRAVVPVVGAGECGNGTSPAAATAGATIKVSVELAMPPAPTRAAAATTAAPTVRPAVRRPVRLGAGLAPAEAPALHDTGVASVARRSEEALAGLDGAGSVGQPAAAATAWEESRQVVNAQLLVARARMSAALKRLAAVQAASRGV